LQVFLNLIFNRKQNGDSTGSYFSTAENQVPQRDIGYATETLVIHFDQERFEKLLSWSNTSSLHAQAQEGQHRQSLYGYLLKVSLC